jgi:hypothetical protein
MMKCDIMIRGAVSKEASHVREQLEHTTKSDGGLLSVCYNNQCLFPPMPQPAYLPSDFTGYELHRTTWMQCVRINGLHERFKGCLQDDMYYCISSDVKSMRKKF